MLQSHWQDVSSMEHIRFPPAPQALRGAYRGGVLFVMGGMVLAGALMVWVSGLRLRKTHPYSFQVGPRWGLGPKVSC